MNDQLLNIIIGLLGVSGSGLLFKDKILSFLRKDSKDSPTNEAPDVKKYLQSIETAAPNADEKFWWSYASQGLTPYQVAHKEASYATRASERKLKEAKNE